MWVWLFLIWLKEEYFNTCSDPVNLFGFVYLVIGGIGVAMLFISLFGMCIGRMRKGNTDYYGVDNGLYDTGDVDFDPYQ